VARITPTSVDYTDKDFDSLRARMVALIGSVFPKWTDFEILSFGNIMMELTCFVGDVLTFYQDAQANESRWATATRLRSIISLAKLIGYEVPGRSAATATVTFYTTEVPSADVVIPMGTIVRTKAAPDSIDFELISAVTIAAESDPPEINGTVVNGRIRTETFDSSERPDQEYILTYYPFSDEAAGSSVIGVVTDAGGWDRVSSFLESESDDFHFMVSVDSDERARIRFGDGINGAIPAGVITVYYVSGGGADGNVEDGALEIVDGSFHDSEGGFVQVFVKDATAGSGGTDRPTVADVRLLAPATIRAPRTTVAREDFEIHALEVTGIARALMLTSDQDGTLDENYGILYVIPTGGGTASESLREAVYVNTTVTKPSTVTFRLDVASATFKTINVAAAVYFSFGADPTTTADAIRAALTAFFALEDDAGNQNTNVDFGFNFKDADGNPAGEVALSDVFNVIRDTAGVRKIYAVDGVALNGVALDAALGLAEFPVLGTVTVRNADTWEIVA